MPPRHLKTRIIVLIIVRLSGLRKPQNKLRMTRVRHEYQFVLVQPITVTQNLRARLTHWAATQRSYCVWSL